MAKNSKRRLLFITVFLTILLSSSVYVALAPIVHAADVTPQEKGLSILRNVVGLDLSKYATASKECLQDSYLDVVPQENMRYTLKSDGSNVDVLFTFAHGKLRMIHVLENEGSPRLTKIATNTLEMAKDFLCNFQTYSGNSFYGELVLILNEVDAGKPNQDIREHKT